MANDSIDRGVLAEAIRATPFAWFVLDDRDDVLFASARAEAICPSPAIWGLVKEAAAQARGQSGSAAVDVPGPDARQGRTTTVEARRLRVGDAPVTVVWVVEPDGDAGGVEIERAMSAVDEARARIDELVDDLARRTEERERLAGLVDAMVHGLEAGVMIVDRSLVVTECTERAARMVGPSRSEMVGRSLAGAGETVGPQLAELVEPCLSGRASHGLVHRPAGPLLVGCAPYEAASKAVLVLQDMQGRGAK